MTSAGWDVVSALHDLAKAVRANTLALGQLTHQEGELMSTAADAVAAVQKLTGDVDALVTASNALIQALKSAPAGAMDQATLDTLVADVQTATGKLESETAAEQAAVTPPAPAPPPA